MILLLRHGQTEFNAAGRLQGQLDSPLTDKGRDQALRMGERVAALAAGRKVSIHTSPLGRALETARLVASRIPGAIGPRPDPRLTEISFGQWDGLTRHEIDTGWPGLRASAPENRWFFHGPDGETLEGLVARVAPALAEVTADPADLRVIVSHGIAGWAVRMAHTRRSPEENIIEGLQQDSLQHLTPDGRVELL